MSMLSMQNPPVPVRVPSSLLHIRHTVSFPFDSDHCSPLPLPKDSTIAFQSLSSSSEEANSPFRPSPGDAGPDNGATVADDSVLMWSDDTRAGSEGRDSTPQQRTPPLRRKSEPAKVRHPNANSKTITFAVIRSSDPRMRSSPSSTTAESLTGKVEELLDEEEEEEEEEEDEEEEDGDEMIRLKTEEDSEDGGVFAGGVGLAVGEGEGDDASRLRDTDATAPTTLPRKRGRPRKHPLPTPSGQMKVAKGRSKTGCITCRRRKKKCDETKPDCMNCRKNAVVCEGYPPKEIWKSGKQKLEESARRNSLSVIPRELPFLIDGIETDVDVTFLDHFVNGFSKVLTLINDDSNPFREILLPMATQHKGLMHSLMCLAGSHLSATVPKPQFVSRKLHHFDCALVTLQDSISRFTSDESQLVIQDPDIASTVALFLMTICEGDTTGQYRSHMDAARFLIIAQAQRAGNFSKPRNEKFREFVMEFFQYHEISNSVTSLDRRPLGVSGDLHLPDFVPHGPAGAFLGIFDGLFNHISAITKLRDRIRQRYREGYEPAVDYQNLREAVAIDSDLRSWQPSYPPNTSNWYAAQLYRQSTWVYLYRTIRPSRPSEKISEVVNEALHYLDQLPLDAGAYSIMLMPVFLLGCSAFEQAQRDRIQQGFDDLLRYSKLRNIKPSLRVVKRVWELMDSNMEDSWDWEKIISEMKMDFMIT